MFLQFLNLFRMGPFRAAQEWGWAKAQKRFREHKNHDKYYLIATVISIPHPVLAILIILENQGKDCISIFKFTFIFKGCLNQYNYIVNPLV